MNAIQKLERDFKMRKIQTLDFKDQLQSKVIADPAAPANTKDDIARHLRTAKSALKAVDDSGWGPFKIRYGIKIALPVLDVLTFIFDPDGSTDPQREHSRPPFPGREPLPKTPPYNPLG